MIKIFFYTAAFTAMVANGASAQFLAIPDMSHGYPVGTASPVLSEKAADGAVVPDTTPPSADADKEASVSAQHETAESAATNGDGASAAVTADTRSTAALVGDVRSPSDGEVPEVRDLGIPARLIGQDTPPAVQLIPPDRIPP